MLQRGASLHICTRNYLGIEIHAQIVFNSCKQQKSNSIDTVCVQDSHTLPNKANTQTGQSIESNVNNVFGYGHVNPHLEPQADM